MPQFNAEITEQIIAAAQEGAAEAVEALDRAFDNQHELVPGEGSVLDLAALPQDWSGAGLGIALKFDDDWAVMVLPESSGLIPQWYTDPGPTEDSKLATLAQELGMILFPDDVMAIDFQSKRVDNLAEAVSRCGATNGAGLVGHNLKAADNEGKLYLLWPVSDGEAFLNSAEESSPGAVAEAAPAEPEQSAPEPTRPAAASHAPASSPASTTHTQTGSMAFPKITEFEQLPNYTQSLLKIRVPVVVNLAATTMPVSSIVDLEIGSVIQFTKSCEETLKLQVADREVAEGETVKIGEKFGLRLTSLLMPEEQFLALAGRQQASQG